MMMSGYSGIYSSVSRTGFISAGSPIQVIPGRRQESISAMLDLRRSRARTLLCGSAGAAVGSTRILEWLGYL
jgi:MOSC domain-containing protein YiiM